MYIEYCFNCGK